MSEIQIRHSVESLFQLKLGILRNMETIQDLGKKIYDQFDSIGGYSPFRVENNFRYYGENINEKSVDQALWIYLVKLNQLEKYMLCTDYQKMLKEIDQCQTPVFTIESANGWIAGLQGLILENVKTLVHDVYSRIINGVYYVGGGYNAEKKKRNNNGIDKTFILRTNDYSSIITCSHCGPSIMDDMEKACYLLDGQTLPKYTIRENLRKENQVEARNKYMTVKLCKNGNTHFTLADETRTALNKYGPTGATIGENIKIKVFTDRW